MKRVWTVLGLGFLGACVIYTGYNVARGDEMECKQEVGPDEQARQEFFNDADIHTRNLREARNAIARRYGEKETL